MVTKNSKGSSTILGLFIFLGFFSLGYMLYSGISKFKEYDRSVAVKGLAEKEYKADKVFWPIKFTVATNNLDELYKKIDLDTKNILAFLKEQNIIKEEITINPPSISDRIANEYSNRNVPFRYFGSTTINVSSKNVDKVRGAILNLIRLAKKGIILKINDYDTRVEYKFTKLNEIKPLMIEEATKKAREVALKFAKDSKSKLGKIKKASQGRFSITSRDKNTEHIKRVRVVSTVEYYLVD